MVHFELFKNLYLKYWFRDYNAIVQIFYTKDGMVCTLFITSWKKNDYRRSKKNIMRWLKTMSDKEIQLVIDLAHNHCTNWNWRLFIWKKTC